MKVGNERLNYAEIADVSTIDGKEGSTWSHCVARGLNM